MVHDDEIDDEADICPVEPTVVLGGCDGLVGLLSSRSSLPCVSKSFSEVFGFAPSILLYRVLVSFDFTAFPNAPVFLMLKREIPR